jgi:hypothetical protein
MNQSEQINELAAALALAQGEMAPAAKDSTNPFFNSKYADLASVWDACRVPLTKHGLSVIQAPAVVIHGEPEVYTYTKKGEERVGIKVATEIRITTRLLHSSGQWIEDTCAAISPFGDPQAILKGITYLRRGSLASFVGVAPSDDDGESVTQARGPAKPVKPAKPDGQAKPNLFMEVLRQCVSLGVYNEEILAKTPDGDDERKELVRDLMGMPRDWMPTSMTPEMWDQAIEALYKVRDINTPPEAR